MSQKRARSTSPNLVSDISTSSVIEDRSSKFTALYSPTISAKDLQSQSNIRNATHRILAWRKPSTQLSLSSKPLIESGHDDDGEKYGGKAVEKVMEAMNVEGTVVVARWYGGVMLGPVRFDHIRDCARAAISKWLSENEERTKRQKLEAESKEKVRLEQVLRERDESIVVLRDLLAKKKNQTASQGSPSHPPAKVPDYSKQPFHLLKRLEDVRDATIGWILKSIEEAEREVEIAEQSEDVEKDQKKDTISPSEDNSPSAIVDYQHYGETGKVP